jgi:hypothetical protein
LDRGRSSAGRRCGDRVAPRRDRGRIDAGWNPRRDGSRNETVIRH